jgi:hypothetical protein
VSLDLIEETSELEAPLIKHSLPIEVRKQIRELSKTGLSNRAIARSLGLSHSTVDKYNTAIVPPAEQEDKKIGEFDWREWSDWAKKGQELKKKSSWSQSGEPTFTLGDGTKPIILATFSDQHIGSWGSDYDLFCQITKEIVDTPNLYMVMLGDETEHAIKLRNVLEVTSQVFTPEIQERFIEAWLKEIDHKIAWTGWNNHSILRQENQSGSSVIKNLLSRHAAYFNGLAHVTLKVGDQEYKGVSNHKFRGNSIYSRVYGPKRYIRMEAPDRDFVLQGDLHTPELDVYYEGGKQHVAITTGSTHMDSGYAKRYFSLLTIPAYPCIVLHPNEHKMTPFWDISSAVKYVSAC